MRNILVTGGAGFIGSNFIEYILGLKAGFSVVNLDLLTYAGNPESLEGINTGPGYAFIKGDIRDRDLLDSIFQKYAVDAVVNFAAQSHVDRSIDDPEIFLSTNIIGTQALLEAAKKSWNLRPGDKYSREYRAGVRFLQISTDEVYGSLGESGMFTEESPLAPNSPYAASKAGADMVVRAYRETFGLPVNITRCSNNYGPRQFPEKLIPLMINNCRQNKSLPVYGDGLHIRDWIYVKDHCEAVHAVLLGGKEGEIYNISGGSEKTNLEIVRHIVKAMGKSEILITFVPDRPGHDRRYAVDSAKIAARLGWKPKYGFSEGMAETIEWYSQNEGWIEKISSGRPES